MKKNVTIPCHCSRELKIEIQDRYEYNSDLEKRILSGDFLTFTCDSCKRVLKPEIEICVEAPSWKITMIPEIERDSFYTGNYSVTADEIVIGYPELVEYIKIRKANLNKNVIEVMKSILLQRAPEDSDPRILLEEALKNELIFHIYGLRENEIGIAKLGMDKYKAIDNDLETLLESDSIRRMLEKPYISANTLAEDFS